MKECMSERSYSEYLIKDYTYWTLYLHENQCYIGRTYLVAKIDGKNKDFMDMDSDEIKEFFMIGRQLKKALHKLFIPDKMNYASLGNIFEHLHIHFIPRYKSQRTFLGEEFIDKQWGKNYAPYDLEFKVGANITNEIKRAIEQSINEMT